MKSSSGIVTVILRFIEFYSTNIDFDLTYLGVYTMIYTKAEACAYFICSCLPGTRPLIRAPYHKSGLDTVFSDDSKKSGLTSIDAFYGATTLKHLNHQGSHTATVSGGQKGLEPRRSNGDTANFIRLEETFHVNHFSGTRLHITDNVV